MRKAAASGSGSKGRAAPNGTSGSTSGNDSDDDDDDDDDADDPDGSDDGVQAPVAPGSAQAGTGPDGRRVGRRATTRRTPGDPDDPVTGPPSSDAPRSLVVPQEPRSAM
ncbi:hypothetical protein Acsp07_01990 [Actinomycetospora sp. NBRC 106378]|nr:hypothetical protein Acsp07_01990 [Actinomycetospora sp. NBRC 106378]